MSNILTETPTVDTTASHFSTPTWVVRVNGTPNAAAVLRSVTLSYGSSVSSAVFFVLGDPDTGTFPAYDDAIEVDINGRNVFKGAVKGITSRISEGGLQKTFTALSSITTLIEKVVDPQNDNFNDRDVKEEDRLTAAQIVQEILGSIPSGTPTDKPGQVAVTDMTLLDAVQTVVNKVGNYKLFWNKDTNVLEVYRFGQGGDVTRQFEKGVNIINLSITDNRQSIVNKISIVGPKKAVRVKQIVETKLDEDENGVFRQSFSITGKNIRNIVVEGQYRDLPFVGHNGALQVLPEDMGFAVNVSGPLEGFAEWPFSPLAIYGNTQGDIEFRDVVTQIINSDTIFSKIGVSTEFDRENDTVKVFLSDVPKLHFTVTKSAALDKAKFGLTGGLGDTQTVKVLTSVFWTIGEVNVSFTRDEDEPIVDAGGGVVERTITDSQYQILVDSTVVPKFDNETEVLDLMQERADAELEKVNRPSIGGTISILGDETVDLKSTVLVENQKLDVVNIVHSFANGFITSISLTNEPFFALVATPITQPERRRNQEQRVFLGVRLTFEEVEVDQNIASQRQIEFQRRLQDAGTSFASYQD